MLLAIMLLTHMPSILNTVCFWVVHEGLSWHSFPPKKIGHIARLGDQPITEYFACALVFNEKAWLATSFSIYLRVIVESLLRLLTLPIQVVMMI